MLQEKGRKLITRIRQNQFLYEELVKRDFKKRYARTILGMGWSVLNPLLQMLIMRMVFSHFFGRGIPHYTIYLFSGMIIFNYFSESTKEGTPILIDNAPIFTKINVPKYLFLFAKNTQALINFLLILILFFVFCALDHVAFTWKFLLLIFPVVCLVFFNLGIGLVLSAIYVFFRDVLYFWGIFLQLLQYVSALFYEIESFADPIRRLFYLNPVYLYIRYFREIVLYANVPSIGLHAAILCEAVLFFLAGVLIYRKYNMEFLYYI
ncbi:MAG: ABC transporter permease [Anaerolineaceae bacterium]|nr:ABC transporter permease [Anaerolineaceae bacterium]